MSTRPEITTSAFWVATAERAVRTAAQVAAGAIGTDAVGITSLDWPQIGAIAATAAVLSVLTSLAADRLGAVPGPSLVSAAAVVKVPVPAPAAPPAPPAPAAPTWASPDVTPDLGR